MREKGISKSKRVSFPMPVRKFKKESRDLKLESTNTTIMLKSTRMKLMRHVPATIRSKSALSKNIFVQILAVQLVISTGSFIN